MSIAPDGNIILVTIRADDTLIILRGNGLTVSQLAAAARSLQVVPLG